MEQRKFYQPDILSHLAEIVQKNTRAYTTDFDFDAKRLWDSAQETDMERRSFLWMCRLLGTWCVLEREVFLDDTNANCIWTHYADCPDGILAYRVVIEGIRDGKLAGKIIPLDYAKQVQRVMQSALPIVKIQYRDKDDSFCENSYHAFMNSSMPYTIRKQPRRYPPVKRGSFRALYLYYLYLLSPRKKRPQKVPFETRAEIRRAKQYRQQFFLLQKYHIDTKPELDMLSDALSNEMQILVDRRKELYALRREQPSEPLNADIDALTAQLRPLRRELRLCGKIAEYAPRMLRQVQESNSPSTENHAPDKARERRHSLWR